MVATKGTVFGVDREQFEALYQENDGFNKKLSNHRNHNGDEEFLDYVACGCQKLDPKITRNLK